MFQIDVPSAASAPPAVPAVGTPGHFTDGNPATGVPGTIVPAWWLEMVQAEVLAVLAAAGIAPGKTTNGQLSQAIQALISGAAPASLAASGWQKLPSGLLVQWATAATVTGASDVVYYPVAFPNAPFGQVVLEENAVGWQSGGTVQPTIFGTVPLSNSAFKLLCARWNGSSFQFAAGDAYFFAAVGH